jgi:tRNA (adenine37-N6)-methyltransferase
MKAALPLVLICLFLGVGESMSAEYVVHPIGEVVKTDESTVLKILPPYRQAMFGLDGFSHIIVLYWFDKNDTPEKRATLKVHPRGDERNPLMGVFATRSPMRPNLIGLAVCKIKYVDADGITVDDIDAYDKTPIIDIKPYIPHNDCVSDATVPKWTRPGDPCR